MVVAGFDVAKIMLDGVVFENGQPIEKPWRISNTASDIAQHLRVLKQTYPGFTAICESTGNYHLELVAACQAQNIPIRILNPIVTKQQIRSTVRKTKTDQVDAAIIARLGCQGEGTLCVSAQYETARQYIRVAIRLTKGCTVIKQLLHATSLRPAADQLPQLSELLEGVLSGQEQAVESLYQTARGLVDETPLRLLTSIPGLGDRTAVTVLAEVDHVGRFRDAKALVAYAGLDPAIRQSGHGSVRYGRLTKRGSVPLRRALFLAATSAQRSDPELRQAYEAKRAQGKPYLVATVYVARKLVHRIYAVLKQQRPYDIRQV